MELRLVSRMLNPAWPLLLSRYFVYAAMSIVSSSGNDILSICCGPRKVATRWIELVPLYHSTILLWWSDPCQQLPSIYATLRWLLVSPLPPASRPCFGNYQLRPPLPPSTRDIGKDWAYRTAIVFLAATNSWRKIFNIVLLISKNEEHRSAMVTCPCMIQL